MTRLEDLVFEEEPIGCMDNLHRGQEVYDNHHW